jgi:hypothetical protein
MFEVPIDKQESKLRYEHIGISVLVLLVVAGAAYYFMSKRASQQPAAAAPAVAAPSGPADPIHDLKIVRATMNKDPMGTTAVWLVTIENKSGAYTYSAIRYETSYIGADNKPIVVNQGTVPGTYAPGEQQNSEIRDTLYPNGTSWYRFKILDAKSSVR